jgi:antitoxin VapB
MDFDVDAWLAALDRYKDLPFMEDGREQPPMPDDDASFDP